MPSKPTQTRKIPDPIPFTADAYAEMEAEWRRLGKLRKEVLGRLQVAREQGDLSENGAYTAAKFELGNIGRQQRQLRYLLHYGQVVTGGTHADGSIDFGSKVTIQSDRRELHFMLVSEHESNPADNKLSLSSPIGRAVKGKKQGDVITVEAPAGTISYTITKVV